MRSQIGVFFTTVFMLASGALAADRPYELSGTRSLSESQFQALYRKIDMIFQSLPEQMVFHITHERPGTDGAYVASSFKKLKIQLKDLGPVYSNPSSICEPVNRMPIGEQRRKEYSDASDKYKTDQLRMSDGIQAYIIKDKSSTPHEKKIVLNLQAVPHLLGEAKAEFPCGHQNSIEDAKASIIHSIARLYDETEYRSDDHKAFFLSKSRRHKYAGLCTTDSEFAGKLQAEDGRVLEINCPDEKAADTLVSETARYRNLSFGWHKPGNWFSKIFSGNRYGESDMAFWARGLNPYEYAADPQTHFAYNFEFFQMDPEYSCRKPVVFKHLSGLFGIPAAATQSDCKVNSKIFLHWTSRVGENYEDINVENGEVDLSPDRVNGISYYRASVGQAAASLFGHAMFRLHMCAPGQSGPNCRRMRQFDLIINPRANPMEMKMDNIRGFFGAYPSQFFISRHSDIIDEYGAGELRHLFNFPVGGYTTTGNYTPMTAEEKQDFLYATLQYYWSYIGRYTFVTNNCADEALELYKYAVPHPSLADKNILTPKGVSEILSENGFVDTASVGDFTEPGLLSKIPLLGRAFWTESDRQQQREDVENAAVGIVDESFLYDTFESIKYIHQLETGKELDSIRSVEKEAGEWFELAEISSSSSTICKTHEKYPEKQARLRRAIKNAEELFARYRSQYERAKGSNDRSAMREINLHYNRIFSNLARKRMMDMADLLVDVAYEVVDRSKKSDKICNASAWEGFKEADKVTLKDLILDYEASSYDLMPHSDLNLYRGGYGIPTERELKRLRKGDDRNSYLQRVGEQSQVLGKIIEIVGPYVGADWDLYQSLNNNVFNLGLDTCRDKLQVIPGTEGITCGDIGEVYRDARDAALDSKN